MHRGAQGREQSNEQRQAPTTLWLAVAGTRDDVQCLRGCRGSCRRCTSTSNHHPCRTARSTGPVHSDKRRPHPTITTTPRLQVLRPPPRHAVHQPSTTAQATRIQHTASIHDRDHDRMHKDAPRPRAIYLRLLARRHEQLPQKLWRCRQNTDRRQEPAVTQVTLCDTAHRLRMREQNGTVKDRGWSKPLHRAGRDSTTGWSG